MRSLSNLELNYVSGMGGPVSKPATPGQKDKEKDEQMMDAIQEGLNQPQDNILERMRDSQKGMTFENSLFNKAWTALSDMADKAIDAINEAGTEGVRNLEENLKKLGERPPQF